MKKSVLKKIIFILMLILFLIIIYLSRSIIQPVFLSLILAYMLSPLVKILTHRGAKKRIAVLITLTMLLGFMFIIIYYIIPGIIRDVVGILYNSQEYTELITKYIGNSGFDGMPSYLKGVINNNVVKLQNMGLDYLNNFFTELIDFTMELPTYILTPVFVYYFLNDSEHFTKLIKSFIPLGIRDKAVELWREIDKVLGSFVRSQLILSLVISGLTFVAMLILKVKYPIIIAFINGITNIIPYFGPVIGFIPAFLAAITQSLNKAILVAVAFFIIQQFESSVIAPKIMGDTMGIHPVFIMIIIILGGKYFGGWGLLLSVPVAGIAKVMFSYFVRNMY
jgi:predicted PurR-regulated permease PerM